MIKTERLLLRRWRDDDREVWAGINADPEVRAHFPAISTREQSNRSMDLFNRSWDRDGVGFAAIERRQNGTLLGMAGLSVVHFEAPVQDKVEIGWRLAREHWGNGYASEAANGWIDHGFFTLDLAEIVSFTVADNARSLAVMKRLGMQRAPELDFEHPSLPTGHRLRPHVVYRMRSSDRRPGKPTGLPEHR